MVTNVESNVTATMLNNTCIELQHRLNFLGANKGGYTEIY